MASTFGLRSARSKIHHLMVGTWTPPGAIFTFEFDEEKLSLELIKRTEINHDEPISWMTFNHTKNAIYGAAMKKWTSFHVEAPSEIRQNASHAMLHDPQASLAETNTRAIFLLAAQQPPYCVYANPFYKHAGHGSVFSVDSSGALQDNVQNYEYQPDAGIHGMVFDPREQHLYSADMGANKIWCHRKLSDGKVELVGSISAPDTHDHPRWVAIHPSGKYLYALMESGNRICEYVIDPVSHMPVYTYHTYPLIPPGIAPTHDAKTGKGLYRSDVCAVSHSGKYLFATSRSNSFSLTGYISAFRLKDGVGSIERQICLQPTPTSGGHSNAVSPCDWSDEWLAITDDEQGWLEIYRWQDEVLARVARCRVQEPGFGMNAIWYD